MTEKGTKNQFAVLKTALPILSVQDIRVVLANQQNQPPTTKIIRSIPLDYDILTQQGIREWKSSRSMTIEQTDITTIKSNNLHAPSKFKVTVEPVNQFESIDEKVRQIEEYAMRIESDFNELQIPEPTDVPEVQPLFSDKRQRHRSKSSEKIEDPLASSRVERELFYKHEPVYPDRVISATEKARYMVRTTEEKMDSGFGRTNIKSKTKETKSKKKQSKKQVSASIPVNWDEVNQLLQQNDF